MDGGVSDNLGLRAYLDAISLLESNPELAGKTLPEKVRKVIFISVNATVHHERGWDRKSKTPGSIPVALAADARTMEHYSADTLAWLQSEIKNLRNQPDLKNKVSFYAIDLSFKQFSEPSEAEYFLSLPTTFSLSTRVVDQLKTAAHTLLYQNPDFKKLLTDLKASQAEAPRGPK